MEFCYRVIKLCLHEFGIINLIIVLKNRFLIRQIRSFVTLFLPCFEERGINVLHSTCHGSAVSTWAMDVGFSEEYLQF